MAILSQINYLGTLRTEATHLASGEKIITDAPTDNHGKGMAFSPTDLVSTALAQCMITLMGIAAITNGFELGPVHARVVKTMAANPRRIAAIEIEMEIEDSYTDRQKAIIERAAINCPVAKSLSENLVQDVKFSYVKKLKAGK